MNVFFIVIQHCDLENMGKKLGEFFSFFKKTKQNKNKTDSVFQSRQSVSSANREKSLFH